jgi:hypothetical protein
LEIGTSWGGYFTYVCVAADFSFAIPIYGGDALHYEQMNRRLIARRNVERCLQSGTDNRNRSAVIAESRCLSAMGIS